MRKGLLSIVLACSLLTVPTAFAQNEDFGKSAVAHALMKRVAETPTAPKQTVEIPKRNAPYAMTEAIPEDVDSLMANVEQQNRALVEEFENLIQKDPLNPDAPKWLFQIAEFHYQMAHYAYLRARRAWMAELDLCADEQCAPEPVPDYSQAIVDYRRLIAEYPTYSHLDDVLFRLGDALIRNQQPKEGVSYLHRLTQSYPDYKDLDAAWLAMGEFYFSQKITGAAQAAYQKIIDHYPHSAYFQYAQYKLAWTYLNLSDEESYETAIALFKQVVEDIDNQYAAAIDAQGQIDENKLNVGVVSFRNQALNDLSSTYAELPDGWKSARDYLSQKLPPDKAREKIEQLGAILNAQGKFEEEVELYSELIADNPTHPHLPDWLIAKIEALKSSNRTQEANDEIRLAIDRLSPNHTWYESNLDYPSQRRTADTFASVQSYQIALDAIQSAENASSHEARDAFWADAEHYIRHNLTFYANEKNIFDLNYTFAYILDERSDAELKQATKKYGKQIKQQPELTADILPGLREAANAYQKVVDAKIDGLSDDQYEQIRVAANRQVFVYANILAASDPEWSIVNSAKAQNFVEEKRGSEIKIQTPLSLAEENFVHSAEQYARLYPKDDETPAFLWRAAEIYRSHNDYEQAAQRFDQIVTHFPQHQYAAVSVGSMFELYYKAKNDEKIEFWAHYLIDHKNFKHYRLNELQNTAAYAIDQQALRLSEQNQIDDAVKTWLRIGTDFPERSDLANAATMKAAACLSAHRQYARAIELLSPLCDHDADNRVRAQACFQVAKNQSERAQFLLAANAFEKTTQIYFAQLSDVSNPPPQNKKASQKSSPKLSTPKQQRAANLSADERREAALSVAYAEQIYKSLNQKEKAAHLIDAYLDANRFHEFDVYQSQNGDFIVDLPNDETQNTTPFIRSDIALLEYAALLPAADAQKRFAQVDLNAMTNLSPQSARRLQFQKIQCDIDAALIDIAKSDLQNLSTDDTWTNAEIARLAFLNGRVAQLDFENVVLEFPIRTLRKRIEEKAKKRQIAEKHFQTAISYKNAQISTAAAYELAQMALHFRDAFKALPPPKELENDPAALDEYTVWIEDELVFPAEDAAASLLDIARQITLQLESYTKHARLSAQSLATLKPDEFPVSLPSAEEKLPSP